MLTTIEPTTLDNITGGTVRASSSDAMLQQLQQTLTTLQQSQQNQSGFNNPTTMLLFAMLATQPRENNVVYVRRGGWGYW